MKVINLKNKNPKASKWKIIIYPFILLLIFIIVIMSLIFYSSDMNIALPGNIHPTIDVMNKETTLISKDNIFYFVSSSRRTEKNYFKKYYWLFQKLKYGSLLTIELSDKNSEELLKKYYELITLRGANNIAAVAGIEYSDAYTVIFPKGDFMYNDIIIKINNKPIINEKIYKNSTGPYNVLIKRDEVDMLIKADELPIFVNIPIVKDHLVDLSGFSGDSAGLMLSLQHVQNTNKIDLIKGRKIAGTGTIELDRTVGAVGDIAQKIAAAEQNNIKIFFVPYGENADEAYKTKNEIGSSLTIVPVKTLDEAIQYLLN